jgi:hypothetical protein
VRWSSASLFVLAILSTQALARTDKGLMTGGGVGKSSCPEFLDSMATARQRGGLESYAGVPVINPFIEYIAGFQTGYNLGAPGVYDVFETLGEKPVSKALFTIEAWCSKHPEADFDDGIFDLLRTLQDEPAHAP